MFFVSLDAQGDVVRRKKIFSPIEVFSDCNADEALIVEASGKSGSVTSLFI